MGCHEPQASAVPVDNVKPMAMRRAPAILAPEPDGSRPFSFLRLVQPVLDHKCVECHAKSAKAPPLAATHDTQPWVASYRNLKPFAFYYDGGGSFTESKTYPGKFGALASGLDGLLRKGHHDVKLTPEEWRRLTLWLDCNSDFYGTYENLSAQNRGEVVWPQLE